MSCNGHAVVVCLIAILMSVAIFGNRSTARTAHADGAYHDTFFGSFFGSLYGIVFMILAIADDNDGTAVVAFPFHIGVAIAKTFHGFVDCFTNSGTLCG